MAPKKERHRSRTRESNSRSHHHHCPCPRASPSKLNSTGTGIVSNVNNHSPAESSSAAMTDSYETSQHTTNTTHHYQTTIETSYLHYDRPWTQSRTIHDQNTRSYATPPMHRWQIQTMREEAYHAIEGSFITDSQDVVSKFEKLSFDSGQVQGAYTYFEENGSMVVEAESEKWAFGI